jgi:predicted CXXCH cytochrome family protein
MINCILNNDKASNFTARAAILLTANIAALILTVSTAFAQPSSNQMGQSEGKMKIESCANCHENPGLQMAVLRPDGLIHNLYVDSLKFMTSIHYRKDKKNCKDCHKDGYDYVPHNSAKTLACFDCHEKLKPKFEEIKQEALQSVHFTTADIKFNCGTCHTPHYMKKAEEMTLAEKNAMCTNCHNDRFNTGGLTLITRHSWHILAPLHLNRTACISCHTKPEEGVSGIAFKHRILKKDEATRECSDCHSPDGKMTSYMIDIGERPKANLTGEEIFKSFYISGATNLKWLDLAGICLLGGIIVGAFGHGLLRIIKTGKGRK